MSDDPEKEKKEEEAKESSRIYVMAKELFSITLALASIISAAVAFIRLSAASADIDGIVNNWSKLPVSEIKFDSTGTCGTGYSAFPIMEWPGGSSLGCGCQSGARYQLDDGSYKDAASSTSGCLSNQTTVNAYTCAQQASMDEMDLMTWDGQQICYKTSFANAFDTPYPDADTGACETGYHNCNNGGTYDDTGAVCVADSFGANACPLTWIGSDDTITQYSGASTSDFTTDATPETPDAPTIRTATADTTMRGSTFYIYQQYGSTTVTNKIGTATDGYLALPVVEWSVDWMQNGDNMYGPCYGQGQTNFFSSLFTASSDQDEYAGDVSMTSSGEIRPSRPSSCSKIDKRWRSLEFYDEDSLFKYNMRYNIDTSFVGPCEPVASGSESSYNFLTSGACSSGTGTACVGSNKGSSTTVPGSTACTACGSDALCRAAYCQSTCGQYWAYDGKTTNIGLMARTQILWKQTCSYSYTDVKKINGPLQSAIEAQTALLVVNLIVNIILIAFGCYIMRVTWINWGSTLHEYSHLEDKVKPWAEFFGNWIKVPVIIATLVLTTAVMDFFVDVSKEECSDETTNYTFEYLAEKLPEVVSSNGAVLAMDLLMLIVPYLYGWIKHCLGWDKEEEEEEETEAAQVEMGEITEKKIRPADDYDGNDNIPSRTEHLNDEAGDGGAGSRTAALMG
jgi:hypothetical protein